MFYRKNVSNQNSSLKVILNLDNGRPLVNPIYNMFNPKGLKYLTRLRLRLSHLNEHQFKHNFQDCINALCTCIVEP